MSRKYHTLLVREEGKWVIASGETMAEIEAEVDRLNG